MHKLRNAQNTRPWWQDYRIDQATCLKATLGPSLGTKRGLNHSQEHLIKLYLTQQMHTGAGSGTGWPHQGTVAQAPRGTRL